MDVELGGNSPSAKGIPLAVQLTAELKPPEIVVATVIVLPLFGATIIDDGETDSERPVTVIITGVLVVIPPPVAVT
jgi:hypothetical protein